MRLWTPLVMNLKELLSWQGCTFTQNRLTQAEWNSRKIFYLKYHIVNATAEGASAIFYTFKDKLHMGLCQIYISTSASVV